MVGLFRDKVNDLRRPEPRGKRVDPELDRAGVRLSQSLSKQLREKPAFTKDAICQRKADLGVAGDELSNWAERT